MRRLRFCILCAGGARRLGYRPMYEQLLFAPLVHNSIRIDALEVLIDPIAYSLVIFVVHICGYVCARLHYGRALFSECTIFSKIALVQRRILHAIARRCGLKPNSLAATRVRVAAFSWATSSFCPSRFTPARRSSRFRRGTSGGTCRPVSRRAIDTRSGQAGLRRAPMSRDCSSRMRAERGAQLRYPR